MSAPITVNDFKWIKGENDLEYIKLLQDTLERQKEITSKAVAKVKELSAQNSPSQISGTSGAVSRILAIETAIEAADEWDGGYDITREQIIRDALEKLPSAQPEIIRCKDCKFYTLMNRETKTGICSLTMHQNFGDDWFCAGAERRTDETD